MEAEPTLPTAGGARRAISMRTVLGILGILVGVSAVAFPSMGWTFLVARQTQSMSNLQKCGRALLLYRAEWEAFPSAAVAESVLADQPTADPNDYWQTGGGPLIGSYAYVGGVEAFAERGAVEALIAKRPDTALLASIFYCTARPAPFRGQTPPEPWHFPESVLPDRVLRFCADGSMVVSFDQTYYKTATGVRFKVFNWANIFDPDRDAIRVDQPDHTPDLRRP